MGEGGKLERDKVSTFVDAKSRGGLAYPMRGFDLAREEMSGPYKGFKSALNGLTRSTPFWHSDLRLLRYTSSVGPTRDLLARARRPKCAREVQN